MDKMLHNEALRIGKEISTNNLNEKMKQFLLDSIDAKKGYIFVYHHSKYEQEYEFSLEPMIILDTNEFKILNECLVYDVEYKVIPLYLAKGSMYYSLLKNAKVEVKKPLVDHEEDVKKLISLCRKENTRNLWVLHPSGYNEFVELLEKNIPSEDKICMLNEDISYKEGDYVVLLLMSKGQHCYDFMQSVPETISVSNVLPLQKEVRKWIEEKTKP